MEMVTDSCSSSRIRNQPSTSHTTRGKGDWKIKVLPIFQNRTKENFTPEHKSVGIKVGFKTLPAPGIRDANHAMKRCRQDCQYMGPYTYRVQACPVESSLRAQEFTCQQQQSQNRCYHLKISETHGFQPRERVHLVWLADMSLKEQRN